MRARRQRRKMPAILVILVGALAAGPAAAGTAETGTAERVEIGPMAIVEQALKHSQSLRSAEKDVEAADGMWRQADGTGWPLLDAEARAGRYEGLKDMAFGPGMVIPAIEDRYSVSVSITQPLYVGGAVIAGRESARRLKRSAELGADGQRGRVGYYAWSAYWGWAKAWHSAESLKAWVQWMEKHSGDVERMKKAGTATENDALSTSVRLEQTRLSLEEARRRERLARAELVRLTGGELAPHARPGKSSEDIAMPAETELESIQAALSGRAERGSLEMSCGAAEERVRAQKADFLPHVFLGMRYEYARPNMMNIPPQDEWQEDVFVGIQVTWSLLDWGRTRGRVAEAEARLAQTAIQKENMEEEIVLDVRRARINLENAVARVEVARKAALAARLNLKSATDLWNNGMARHADVLDAQAKFAEAEYDVIAGSADVAVARAEAAFSKGEMKRFLDQVSMNGGAR